MNKNNNKRIHLYKGKRLSDGKWIKGSLSIEYDGSTYISFWVSELIEPEVNYWEMVHKSYEVDRDKICEFTNCYDKNNKEIFENDTLYSNGYYCRVIFENGSFKSLYEHPEDGETLTLEDLCYSDFEVMGNIYD